MHIEWRRSERLLFRALTLGASIVPRDARVDWRAEWEAELRFLFASTDEVPTSRCASLCYGLLRDAVGLRVGGADEWRADIAAATRAMVAQWPAACAAATIAGITAGVLVPLLLVQHMLIVDRRAGAPAVAAIVAATGALCVVGLLWTGSRAVGAVASRITRGRPVRRAVLSLPASLTAALISLLCVQRLEDSLGRPFVGGSGVVWALAVALSVALLRLSDGKERWRH